MLSESDKGKIKLAETYRVEALTEILQAREKKLGYIRYLQFFNSKFGIWLLSVIFASGGLKAYEDYKAKVYADYTNLEIIEKLDLEISYKFRRLFFALSEAQREAEDTTAQYLNEKLRTAREIALGMDVYTGEPGEYIYPEYANRSIFSLLVEQKRIRAKLKTPDAQLEEIIAKMEKLPELLGEEGIDFSDVPVMKKFIEDELMSPRWKND
jgi:hypothetical protein